MILRGLLLPLWAISFFGQDNPALRPEPSKEIQNEKLKIIKEIYKDEYSKRTPADQAALARKLLQSGVETQDDPASKFVQLREARDLAAAAGDLDGALSSVDELARSFAIDPLAMKVAVLGKAAAAPRDAEVTRVLARAYFSLVSSQLRADDYDGAANSTAKAEAAAKVAQDIVLLGKAQELRKEITSLKEEYHRVKNSLEKPGASDQDPVGRFLCFVRGDWANGLPLLAAGGKPPLKTLAERDLVDPQEPEKQVEVADGWWELSQKEKSGWRKQRMQERAQRAYELGAKSATGLTRAKIDKRLADIEDAQPGPVNLLRFIDVKQDPLGEWTVEGATLISDPSLDPSRILVPYSPPEEFDLIAVVERRRGSDAILLGCSTGSSAFAIWIDGFSALGGRSGLECIDGIAFDKNPASVQGALLTNNKQSTLLLSVRKSGISATLDGKSLVNFQGNFGRLSMAVAHWKVAGWKGMFIGTCASQYHVSKLRLVPLSGQGKRIH